MTANPTYYDVLGIPKTASFEEIKKAYRHCVKIYHPDANSAPNAAFAFKQVNEAYNVLIEENSRKNYDESLEPVPPPKTNNRPKSYTSYTDFSEPDKPETFKPHKTKTQSKSTKKAPERSIPFLKGPLRILIKIIVLPVRIILSFTNWIFYYLLSFLIFIGFLISGALGIATVLLLAFYFNVFDWIFGGGSLGIGHSNTLILSIITAVLAWICSPEGVLGIVHEKAEDVLTNILGWLKNI